MQRDPVFNTDAILQWSYDIGLFGLMNSKWGWPIAESLHFIGLTLLIGTVGMFDLRMMGIGKSMPLAALHRLVPFGVAGYLLNLVTGLMFFLSAPAQYLYNPAFQTKMMFMALAGANMAVFYATTARAVAGLAPEAQAPLHARVIAFVSLTAWIGVIAGGRPITFFRPPYEWCAWCGG
jgi:uncharacterized membrane protein